MSSRTPDLTQPGPAGLAYDRNSLISSAREADIAVGATLERWCAFCGQPATHGFGVFIGIEGIWTCADADCRAAGRAAVSPFRLQAAE